MKNELNITDHTVLNVNSVISNENFPNLSEDMQRETLRRVARTPDEGGFMSKLFGTDKELIPLYVAFLICIIVLIVAIIVWAITKDIQIWMLVIPMITSALGYVFGRSSNK